MQSADPAMAETHRSGSPLWLFGPVCGLFGVAAWVFYGWAFHGDPGQDWMVFYTAARAYIDGNLPLIFDGRLLTAALNRTSARAIVTSFSAT